MKAIFFDPHGDDVVIGAGGSLIKLLDAGVEVKFVCFTDGRHGSEIMSPGETKRIRAVENFEERKFLGVKDFEDFNIEDGTLSKLSSEEKAALIKRISDILNSYGPDFVFTLASSEMHSDHKSVGEFVSEALKNHNGNPPIIKYVVWDFPDFYPKRLDVAEKVWFVDITNTFEKKLAALRLHKSQVTEGRYDEWILHHNAIRARQFDTYGHVRKDGPSPQFAEILGIYGGDPVLKNKIQQLLGAADITNISHGRSEEKISM